MYGEPLFFYMRILESGVYVHPLACLFCITESYNVIVVVLFYLLMNDTKSIMWFEIPKYKFFSFINK